MIFQPFGRILETMNGRELDVFKFGKITGVPNNNFFPIFSAAVASFEGFLDQAETIAVSSDSADDQPGGGGAISILITGLDENGIQQTEEVDIGSTSTKAFQFISTAKVIDSEDDAPLGANHGTISMVSSGTGALMNEIPEGSGRTQLAAYRIPSDVSGEMISLHTFVTNENDVAFELIIREGPGKPWTSWGSPNSESKDIDVEFRLPRYLGPGWDVMVMGGLASGAILSAFFEIQLRPLDGIAT